MTPYLYTNTRPVNEREMALIEQAAQRFWQQRTGRTVNPQLLVSDNLYDSSDGVSPDARGIGTTRGFDQDRLYYNGKYLGTQLNRMRSSKSAKKRRQAVKNVYGLDAHELGHLLGLQHPEDPNDHGIMQADGDKRQVPGDWRPLAKQVLGDAYYNPRLWRKTSKGWVRRRG